jgi:hypothetical protein
MRSRIGRTPRTMEVADSDGQLKRSQICIWHLGAGCNVNFDISKLLLRFLISLLIECTLDDLMG